MRGLIRRNNKSTTEKRRKQKFREMETYSRLKIEELWLILVLSPEEITAASATNEIGHISSPSSKPPDISFPINALTPDSGFAYVA
ncbi:hypothetical protein SLA2020_465710 [Shorea laevis]